MEKETKSFRSISQFEQSVEQTQSDPLLQDGSILHYERQHYFTIKIQQTPEHTQTLKNQQLLSVKVAIEEDLGIVRNIKIQLTSDTDLYFNFLFTCSQWEFKKIKEKQNFFIEYAQFPEVILNNFNKTQSDPNYQVIFYIFSEVEGKMQIIRKSQFKNDILMQFEFHRTSPENIDRTIQYRYDTLRNSHHHYEQKMNQIYDIIRSKNPSLLMQIKKAIKQKCEKFPAYN